MPPASRCGRRLALPAAMLVPGLTFCEASRQVLQSRSRMGGAECPGKCASTWRELAAGPAQLSDGPLPHGPGTGPRRCLPLFSVGELEPAIRQQGIVIVVDSSLGVRDLATAVRVALPSGLGEDRDTPCLPLLPLWRRLSACLRPRIRLYERRLLVRLRCAWLVAAFAYRARARARRSPRRPPDPRFRRCVDCEGRTASATLRTTTSRARTCAAWRSFAFPCSSSMPTTTPGCRRRR